MIEVAELEPVPEPYPLADAFRRDWRRLHQGTPFANVFTSIEWIEASWNRFAGPDDIPMPIRFLDRDGATRAMAFHMQTRISRKIGSLRCWRSVDYNAQRIVPVLAPGIPGMAAAIASIHRRWGDVIDVFDFFKLDPMEGGLDRLCGTLSDMELRPRLEVFNRQPRIRLPGSFKEYAQGRSKNTWRKLRQKRRALGEEMGEVRAARFRGTRPRNGREIESALADMEKVFRNSWQLEAALDKGRGFLEALTGFYRDMILSAAAGGTLDLNILYAGNEPMAFDFNIVEGGVIYMISRAYDSRFKKFGPGSLLFMDWVRDSIERGDGIIEFGGEFLEYKSMWSNESTTSHHLRIRGRTLRALVGGILGR